MHFVKCKCLWACPKMNPLPQRFENKNAYMNEMYLINGFDRASPGFGSDSPTGLDRARGLPHLGSVQLVLTLGDPPCQAKTTIKFLIVDAPSAYNMLLGRPSLNAIRAVPSAYHMVVKFPTENGVGMV